MSTEPIVNKYREGKLKSTLKRESKDRETAQSISQWYLEDCVLVALESRRLAIVDKMTIVC